MRYAGRRRSETNPLRSVPLFHPAAMLSPFQPLPAQADPMPCPEHYRPRTAEELRGRELANAEAALREMVAAYDAARAGIGEANRTHTQPVMCGSRVLLPALPYSAERRRERKSYAFRLFNQRRGQLAAARRRVDAARAELDQPSLALVEERQAVSTELRASKRATAGRTGGAA